MRDSQMFTDRAKAAQVEANAATLDNVRERCLRSERAWSEMAERSRRVEAWRDARAIVAEAPLTALLPSL